MSKKQKTLFEAWSKQSQKENKNAAQQIESSIFESSNEQVFQLTSKGGPSHLGPDGFDYEAGKVWIYPTNYPIRDYQLTIVKEALFRNTLVVLPTGLGKTFIAAVVMYNIYRWYPTGKVVFMAPTRPLVAQQIEACRKITGIPESDTTQMTGTTVPEERHRMWCRKRVFFLTPQVLSNDLARNICQPESIKCLVVDEAHKALGNHAYCQVVQELQSHSANFRVLALSATPGSDVQAVKQVICNLLISHVELRSEESDDVCQYTHSRDIEKVVVPLGDRLTSIKSKFLDVTNTYLKRLTQRGGMGAKNPASLSKFQILKIRDEFSQRIPEGMNKMTYGLVMADFSLCISLYHAYELLMLHGARPFYNFLEGIVKGEKSIPHARSELMRNAVFEQLMIEIEELYIPGIADEDQDGVGRRRKVIPGHPKLEKLLEVVLNHFIIMEQENCKDTRVMIFSQYRDSVQEIVEMFDQHQPRVKAMSFIGQSSKSANSVGYTQKHQLKVLQAFRVGGYNTLVSTCVGEEGLDIGEVDLIVCFDCPKSPIRQVQRMGRTGRLRKGRIIMLVAEGKEEQMFKTCESKKKSIYRAITNGFPFAQFYQSTTSLLPPGVNPECLKKVIIVEEKSVFSKAKNSKTQESAFLNPDELKEYEECFKVPKNNAPLLPKPTMVSLSPHPYEAVRDEPQTRLSLSRWMLWQSTPQRTSKVSHSARTLLLTRLVEKINFSEEGQVPQTSIVPRDNNPPSPTLIYSMCQNVDFSDDVQDFDMELSYVPEQPNATVTFNNMDFFQRYFGVAFTKPPSKPNSLDVKPAPTFNSIAFTNPELDIPETLSDNKSLTSLTILNKKMKAQLRRQSKELGINMLFSFSETVSAVCMKNSTINNSIVDCIQALPSSPIQTDLSSDKNNFEDDFDTDINCMTLDIDFDTPFEVTGNPERNVDTEIKTRSQPIEVIEDNSLDGDAALIFEQLCSSKNNLSDKFESSFSLPLTVKKVVFESSRSFTSSNIVRNSPTNAAVTSTINMQPNKRNCLTPITNKIPLTKSKLLPERRNSLEIGNNELSFSSPKSSFSKSKSFSERNMKTAEHQNSLGNIPFSQLLNESNLSSFSHGSISCLGDDKKLKEPTQCGMTQLLNLIDASESFEKHDNHIDFFDAGFQTDSSEEDAISPTPPKETTHNSVQLHSKNNSKDLDSDIFERDIEVENRSLCVSNPFDIAFDLSDEQFSFFEDDSKNEAAICPALDNRLENKADNLCSISEHSFPKQKLLINNTTSTTAICPTLNIEPKISLESTNINISHLKESQTSDTDKICFDLSFDSSDWDDVPVTAFTEVNLSECNKSQNARCKSEKEGNSKSTVICKSDMLKDNFAHSNKDSERFNQLCTDLTSSPEKKNIDIRSNSAKNIIADLLDLPDSNDSSGSFFENKLGKEGISSQEKVVPNENSTTSCRNNLNTFPKSTKFNKLKIEIGNNRKSAITQETSRTVSESSIVTFSKATNRNKNAVKSKQQTRPKNGFLLTQAVASGSDTSSGDEIDEEDCLEGSFIDDETIRESPPVGHSMYLKSVKNVAGLPRGFKLAQRQNTMSTVFLPDEGNTSYLLDSFCVEDDEISLASSADREEFVDKQVQQKRKRIVELSESGSSDDEMFVKKIKSSPNSTVFDFPPNSSTPKSSQFCKKRKRVNIVSSDEDSDVDNRRTCQANIQKHSNVGDLQKQHQENKNAKTLSEDINDFENISFDLGWDEPFDVFECTTSDANVSLYKKQEQRNNNEPLENCTVSCEKNEEAKDSSFKALTTITSSALPISSANRHFSTESHAFVNFVSEENKFGASERRPHTVHKNTFIEDNMMVGTTAASALVHPSAGQPNFSKMMNTKPIISSDFPESNNVLREICSSSIDPVRPSSLELNHPGPSTSSKTIVSKSSVSTRDTMAGETYQPCSSKYPMIILVDSRELASGKPVVSILRTKHGVQSVVMQLASADYIVGNQVAVERIFDAEFPGSGFVPPKLAKRVQTLVEYYDKSYVIVETDSRRKSLGYNRQSTKSLQSAVSMFEQPKCKMVFSNSTEETASILFSLLQKEVKKRQNITVPTSLSPKSQKLFDFYRSIPRISSVCALNLVYYFPSPALLFRSSVEQIKASGCISARRAKVLLEYLHCELLSGVL